MHFLLILPFEEKKEIILRNLNSLTSLISISMNFASLIAETLDVIDIFFIKRPTFYCWCVFPVFSFSQFPYLVSGLASNDGFTEGPVNRAITTTSPSVTACPHSHPSGIKSLCGSFSLFLSFLFITQSLFCAWGHFTWGHPQLSNGLQGTLKFASYH